MCNHENNYFEEKVEVISFREKKKGVYSVWFNSEKIALTAKPGQFLNIQVSDETSIIPVLRRPFAISSVLDNTFEMMFHVVGRGTELLSKIMTPGKQMNVLGPLGNGFKIFKNEKPKLLIAGGIGIAPLKSLMQYFVSKGEKVVLVWGNRDKSDFFDIDFFMDQDIMLYISSDNGSIGYEGTVLEMLKSEIANSRIGKIEDYDSYVVGPTPMMKAVADYFLENDQSCQVSLEEPMACGIGVCQGCAVKKRNEDGYLLVCKDGPVFDAGEIDMASLLSR